MLSKQYDLTRKLARLVHLWHIGDLCKNHVQNMFLEISLPSLKVHISQQTWRALVIVFKFEPSSLTYAVILFFKPYSFKRLVNFFANAYHVVLEASNKPIITCFGV
jgi:hypothetical protein